VAPFPGMIYKGNNSNEVIIECDTAALKDITIVITNVKVNTTILHPSDELYIVKRASIMHKLSFLLTLLHPIFCENMVILPPCLFLLPYICS
jgi:hypothetical protein